MNKEVIKELSAKAREAVATTRIVSGQREMTWLPEAFEEKFFQLATEWEREACAKVCEDLDAWNLDDPGSTAAAAIREALTSGANEQPAQQEPVEVKQIAEALRQVGLTLVRTGGSFRVMDLDRIEAQTTSPSASKPWVGLTDEEMLEVVHYSQLDNARAIEAKLKEKNT